MYRIGPYIVEFITIQVAVSVHDVGAVAFVPEIGVLQGKIIRLLLLERKLKQFFANGEKTVGISEQRVSWTAQVEVEESQVFTGPSKALHLVGITGDQLGER